MAGKTLPSGHGGSATQRLEDLRIRNITIATGLIDTNTAPVLMRVPESGQLDIGHMNARRFALDDCPDACQVFADPAHTGALQVVLSRHRTTTTPARCPDSAFGRRGHPARRGHTSAPARSREEGP